MINKKNNYIMEKLYTNLWDHKLWLRYETFYRLRERAINFKKSEYNESIVQEFMTPMLSPGPNPMMFGELTANDRGIDHKMGNWNSDVLNIWRNGPQKENVN